VTLTRTLLASTAISLCSLGFSHAASFNLAQPPAVGQPAIQYPLVNVQMSVADAEDALAAALDRKAEAESTGGDVATAQAEVEAAQAPADPAPAPATEQPVSEPEPAAASEATPAPSEPVAPSAAEAPDDSGVEVQATGEGSAEAEQPTEAAPVEAEPGVKAEGQAEQPAAAAEPKQQPAEPASAEEPVAPKPVPVEEPAASDQPVPASEAPENNEPVGEAAPAIEAPDTQRLVAPKSEAQAETAPEPAEAADTPASAQTDDTPAAGGDTATEPMTDDATSAPEASDAAPSQQSEAESPAPAEEEVLTLPVEDGAPVLDSAKEEPSADESGTQPAPAAASSEPAPPPPTSDAEAQAPASRSAAAPEAAMSERGERVNEAPPREAQTNVTIINQTDNRTIIEVDNRTVIEHDERERLRAGSEEVYYERLRGGRTREVIVRPNGVQLVTISNRWGDVIQRSRIMPDGQEYVLFYAEANSDGSREAFVDPGRNLPPLRLGIPIADYILDATDAEPSAYLDFLLEPPVEQVERLYSVEEVRRSARIRDKVRRVDMDSLTFEFGKASIAEDQIQRLSDVADAMSEILDRNPAETFLIEGHTDAVGRDELNLLLSDKRAETIAVALTDVFGIPPENLVTQGYGERYLKVRTEAPERLNRRVTIRRITPLVTPVASR